MLQNKLSLENFPKIFGRRGVSTGLDSLCNSSECLTLTTAVSTVPPVWVSPEVLAFTGYFLLIGITGCGIYYIYCKCTEPEPLGSGGTPNLGGGSGSGGTPNLEGGSGSGGTPNLGGGSGSGGTPNLGGGSGSGGTPNLGGDSTAPAILLALASRQEDEAKEEPVVLNKVWYHYPYHTTDPNYVSKREPWVEPENSMYDQTTCAGRFNYAFYHVWNEQMQDLMSADIRSLTPAQLIIKANCLEEIANPDNPPLNVPHVETIITATGFELEVYD